MPELERDAWPIRSLKTLGAAWALAAAIGVLHHVFNFQSGFVTALGSSIVLPLIGALLGPFVGLFSSSPYFTPIFKLGLGMALVAAVALFYVGVTGRSSWWRQCIGIGGAILWMVAGLIGFGPQ